MAKVRKDTKGRVLHKGELFRKDKGLYCYAYSDSFGKRRYIYSDDLFDLRDKEKNIQKCKLDGVDKYAFAKADINYVFDRYISTKSELRGSTYSNYSYTYNHFVRAGFGKNRISDIKYSDVLIFYNELYDKGLKINTIDSVHGVLHPVFQMAVRDNVIRYNPTDGAMAELKRKRKATAGIKHALTIEEERAFLGFLEKDENVRWKPLFTFMFGTGCRIGEVIGLRWEDLDFENNVIDINHNVTYYQRKDGRCEYEVGLPKTEAGIRKIPMLDEVKAALLEEKSYQDKNDHHCIMEVSGMKNFIFCNRYKLLQNPMSVNRAIKRLVMDYNALEEVKAVREGRKEVRVPQFSCHITRHTFCTRLCENETNVKVIQYVMGHKDIRTTMDIYAEVSEAKRQEAFKGLNKNGVL